MRDWTVMRALLVGVLVAGCYSPAPQEGAPCGDNAACPSPLACHDGLCTRGGDAGIDGDIDAPDAPRPDADLTCSCSTSSKLTCGSGNEMTCVLGCSATPVAHCKAVVPSNGVDPMLTAGVTVPLVLTGPIVADTDTGEISGAFTRAAGEGVSADVGFKRHTHAAHGFGVFYVAKLTVTSPGSIRFKGSRAAVILIGQTGDIAGTLDVSAGCGGTDRSCPGPSGTPGIRTGTTATDACTGKNGDTELGANSDSGGGGGGGGLAGASGGDSGTFIGGSGGGACMTPALDPLFGGGGGGGGGRGSLSQGPIGGGGGGALQITALQGLTISGMINANGSGGEGGMGAPTDGPAAGGGGAGGAILIEAPIVNALGATIVANGGGGGGASNSMLSGMNGEDGKPSASPASGGNPGASPSTGGGAGGAGQTAAQDAVDATSQNNGGGGGGAVGRIFARGMPSSGLPAVVSPPPSSAPIITQ